MEVVRQLALKVRRFFARRRQAALMLIATSMISCTPKPRAFTNTKMVKFERDLQKWYRTVNR